MVLSFMSFTQRYARRGRVGRTSTLYVWPTVRKAGALDPVNLWTCDCPQERLPSASCWTEMLAPVGFRLCQDLMVASSQGTNDFVCRLQTKDAN